MIYVIATWIEYRRSYVLTTSSRERYDSSGSPSLLLDIMYVLFTPAGIPTLINDYPSDLALLGCVDLRLESNNPSNFLHRRRDRYEDLLIMMSSSKHFPPFEVCGGNGVVSEFMTARDGDFNETQINWGVATMAATLGTNILCTALIVARILYVARGHRGIMGGIRTYRGVLEIVVESAALYSIIYVILMILYPLKGNGYMYPQALSIPVTCIAPTLIVLRVASGKGRPEESSQETQSSLHFQTGSTIETATDDGEEDTRQGNVEGTAPMLSGSVEQV
ncbi:hypothetical protein EV421DRAFT_1904339 [Armillaria borealis]|uniref:Uncharacterized protein n=1 Tax=Armillaria borealis TaxID=47425 RepID=A0AA39JG46_9AGAR|nr:hypothetical protein EV421DRAFT_1904339 [Armillaria borealis]